ncbi:type I-C CRISPR-associated protein Cas8c/Csd1 [Enterococcus sp. JM4C]|uniref:type I-C CRISPR-associated protein Cas8c/Csd1 n=1 Tax=Candidatus Enterococcus huntleyi TaxID=1857217 RepID=UPI00137A2F27|nr:type I-C CRISPR-associated protein Cas8c/Csd1 [Enterococcus sp. JM4C]KAF1296680.1 type I-C CRISPR-associated protein Cas8c/Csd1 [Enterococcus sp. JM4C]
MTWLSDLFETYEVNSERVGIKEKNRWGQEITLLPISHAYQNAQVEVTITPNGDLFSATVVPKDEAATLIPVTIDSAGRTSSPSPHGLHDGLQYVAGDYQEYGGKYKKENAHLMYLENLRAWCHSDYANARVKSILTYLEKGTLIKDLLDKQVLVAENNQLLAKWSADLGDKPPLFTVLVGDQFSTFIRFNVHELGSVDVPVWDDKQVMDDYVNYYTQKQIEEGEGLDYVTGKQMPLTENHPSKVRYGGDMAKLISGNDSTNFTYRGRFSDKNQVATIGYEVSQKAHNALKWLISRQGYTNDGRVFLVWSMEGVAIPTPEESTYDFFFDEEEDSILDHDTTAQKFAEVFRSALSGYQKKLAYESQIQLMILDSATKGRMGILYYQVLPQQLYFDRLENWHETCYWQHTGVWNKKNYQFFGAPSLKDIAETAYGSRGNEALIKNTIQQLYSCVVDGKDIPMNVVQSALRRVSNPVNREKWEWNKELSVACSVMNKHYKFKKGEKSVALDREITDRNYLFGRLLAVADVLEERALMKAGVKRNTNAKRYMNTFSMRPLSTWKIIQENLIPYQIRLKDTSHFYQKELDEIGSKIVVENNDYGDAPLNGKYLLGYYSQREALINYKNNTSDTEEK